MPKKRNKGYSSRKNLHKLCMRNNRIQNTEDSIEVREDETDIVPYTNSGVPNSQTVPYSPSILTAQVGNNYTEITDDTIQIVTNLMRAYTDPKSAPYIQFFTPAQIHFMAVEYKNSGIKPHSHIPTDKDSLNIHPLYESSQHWVTSYFDRSADKIYIYDSLMTQSHLNETSTQLQLIYGMEQVRNVSYVTVTQQSSEPICGIMAIAFAFSSLHGDDPAKIHYNIYSARKHLKECISNGAMVPFPNELSLHFIDNQTPHLCGTNISVGNNQAATFRSTPSTSTNIHEPTNVSRLSVPSTATNIHDPTNVSRRSVPSTATNIHDPTNVSRRSVPSTATNIHVPTNVSRRSVPSTATNIHEPTNVSRRSVPSSATNIHEPTNVSRRSVPSTATNIHDPTNVSRRSVPSTATNIHDPTNVSRRSVPSRATNIHEPTNVSRRSVPSTATNIHEPTNVSRRSVPSTATNIHVPTNVSRCSVPSTATNIHEPTNVSRRSVPSRATNIHEPTNVSRRSVPSRATNIHDPTNVSCRSVPSTATNIHEPTNVSRRSVPSTATNIHEPTNVSRCSVPSTATNIHVPTNVSRCNVPSRSTNIHEPTNVSCRSVPSTATSTPGRTKKSGRCVQATVKSRNEETISMKKYFKDQMEKQNIRNKEIKDNLEKQNTSALPRHKPNLKQIVNRKQKATDLSTCDKKIDDRNKNRIRKQLERALKKTDQNQTDKIKDAKRKRQSRNSRTRNEIETDKMNDKKRKFDSRNSRTHNEIETDKINDKKRKFDSRNSRTHNEIETDKINDKKRKCDSRNSRTHNEIETDKSKNKKKMCDSRNLRTHNEIETDKINDKKRKCDSRNSRTHNEIETDKINDKKRKCDSRNSRTHNEIETDKINDKKRKCDSRNSRTHNEIETDKSKNNKRMCDSRNSMTSEIRQNEHLIDMARKQKSRNQLKNDLDHAIENFRKAIKQGPSFVCSCCCRQLYRRSVIKLNSEKYTKISKSDLETYLTKEDWICNTCHNKLTKGKIPNQGQANCLQLTPIPQVLQKLYPLEVQLIAKVIPFMKIVAMPRGAQHGIKGQVVLVPANLEKVETALPRPTSQSHIISLALKRRLSDKHHVHKQYIRPQFVIDALQYLKDNHSSYSNVNVNTTWHEKSQQDDEQFWNAATNNSTSHDNATEIDNDTTMDKEEINENSNSEKEKQPDSHTVCDDTIIDSDDEMEEQNPVEFNTNLQNERSVNIDTCIYPTDGPDVHTNEILNIAPGENQMPISRKEPEWEQMSFPKLFPDGKFTYNMPRKIRLTPKKYINSRLLSKDSRFAESPEYTFMALDWLEREAIKQSISITTRKSFQEDITCGQLKNPQRISKLLTENQIFATFKNIRGTPQYFKQMHLDMLAKLRQYGPYTFFISGSAAEFHWPEVISIIGIQYGEKFTEQDIHNMTWNDKRMWLQRNPVTAARHIDYIFEQLWDKVILSGVHPVGQVLNFDLRKEMQGRGTAHFHAAIHVKGAPKLDVDPDNEFTTFANKFVKCEVPDKDQDPELYQLVTARQIHHHTRTCKMKQKKACRFHYPRPPSPSTVLARVPDGDDAVSLKKISAQVLGKMFDTLQSCSTTEKTPSYEELLDMSGITDEHYQTALKTAVHRTHLVMKRSPEDLYTNNYNPILIKCLRSNMDIQMITSIWACIAYITSYICKPEKTMSELMQKASKEANEKGVTDKLYHIANQLRKGREVSHHEAIMRCLSMPLRRSNVPVTFVATDFKENRTCILKQRSVLDTMEDDDTDIYMTTIHDRYAARPNSVEQISFADFVSKYRLTSSSTDSNNEEQNEVDEDVTETVITLKDGLGQMSKRKRPQVIRYHYVSQEKDEEAYFHRLLLLYQPWRSEDQLKTHASYKQSFEHVRDQLVPKIKLFEPFHDDVESVLENFDPDDLSPELWENLTANIEQEKEGAVVDDPNYEFLDPENLPADVQEANLKKSSNTKSFTLTKTFQIPDNDFYKLIQSLNTKQRHLFDFIHCWATNSRLSVNHPDPFNIFLSGGGGVGKSHLIKVIYEGVTRALRTPANNPDLPTVLLTASTGKAAVNINGTTLHSAFHLPIKDKSNKFEYKKPGTETLNKLRSHYLNVKLIIADEISMFGARSLMHLHLTLQHIFEIHDKPFAGISILAVGDLLQLNPVGDSPVFKNPSSGYGSLAGSLWTQHFKLHELTQIVRQKNDPTYANILSRIRIGNILNEDMKLLKDLEHTNTDNFPDSTVKIFLTNKQVATFNEEKMNELPEKITIRAKDSKRDTNTNTVPITIMEENIYKTGGLPSILTIAKNSKAMITKNIDIGDHLVNGVIGTVQDIYINDKYPTAGVIFMRFESPEIGREAKKATPPRLKDCVPIKAVTANFLLTAKSPMQVERTMFPIVPAFGITAHKSQGSTYNFIIGDLTLPPSMRTVMPGQLYTMLSRATNRNGLKLIEFSSNKIKVNQQALQEMDRMRKDAIFDWVHPLDQLPMHNTMHIGFLNVRSLNLHIDDIKANSVLQNLTTLCFTETHTKQNHEIPGYHSFHSSTQHGLAMFLKEDSTDYSLSNIEDLQIMMRMLRFSHENPVFVAVTYRPHDMNKKHFVQMISNLLKEIPKTCTIVIGGDFNLGSDDVHLQKMCKKYNLIPLINQPTHFHGNNLDQILTTDSEALPCVFPVPYSDHFLTCISLQ